MSIKCERETISFTKRLHDDWSCYWRDYIEVDLVNDKGQRIGTLTAEFEVYDNSEPQPPEIVSAKLNILPLSTNYEKEERLEELSKQLVKAANLNSFLFTILKELPHIDEGTVEAEYNLTISELYELTRPEDHESAVKHEKIMKEINKLLNDQLQLRKKTMKR